LKNACLEEYNVTVRTELLSRKSTLSFHTKWGIPSKAKDLKIADRGGGQLVNLILT